MDIGQLRREFIRLTHCENIKDSHEMLNIYSDYLLQSIWNFKIEYSTKIYERDAILINQMILTKVLHIKQIVNGVKFKANDGTLLDEIIDPTVLAVLIRNVYETVGVFNLVYRQTKNNDERLVLYNLWSIAGLKYRQRFESEVTQSENLQKLNDEKQEIDRLIEEIKETSLYIYLSKKDQEKIDTKIKEKDFKIIFLDNKVKFLIWQDLSKTMGVKVKLFDKIYTYFSLYSHPSNVSVFQFGDMFQDDDKAFLDMTNYNLQDLFGLISIFMADYIKLFPKVIKIFGNQPLINQVVLNGRNILLRGKEYSINDSWKHLG